MEWPIILAIIIAVPLILLPVVFVWYLNFGGALLAARKAHRERARTKLAAVRETYIQE